MNLKYVLYYERKISKAISLFFAFKFKCLGHFCSNLNYMYLKSL